jgi:TorA maturation chaperone TorD
MSENPLAVAIELVGGQAKLARLIGVSQPHVWHWLHKAERVPAEHVIAIEKATGGRITRAQLRPDLYPADEARPAAAAPAALAEEDALRAQVYRLLGRLLAEAPSGDLLRRVGAMIGDTTPMGEAVDALARAAREIGEPAAEREYFHLFIGLAGGEMHPYASYYLTGFLYEKPLARLRSDLARLGIANGSDRGEPEDHIAALCETMAAMIEGSFGKPVPVAEQRAFFDKHIAPWAARFFADLEKSERARLYKPLGAIGRHFMAIEADAFALAA